MNEIASPAPLVEAEFHVEPHPDPVIQGFIALVTALRAEIARLKEELSGAETR
jgi:hypothetical protein